MALSEGDVVDIIRLYPDHSIAELSRQYGVGWKEVRSVLEGDSYPEVRANHHLPPPIPRNRRPLRGEAEVEAVLRAHLGGAGLSFLVQMGPFSMRTLTNYMTGRTRRTLVLRCLKRALTSVPPGASIPGRLARLAREEGLL